MRFAISPGASRCGIRLSCFFTVVSCFLIVPQAAIVQAGYPDGDPAADYSGTEKIVRAVKNRVEFSIANVFTSRDIWRGLDWFGDNDPAYLLGGDMIIDITPYDEQSKRDIWEVKLHTMLGGAYALTGGHENIDRWKVMGALENKFFKYIDFDIGYEHYGLPAFDDHDRDFDELFMRGGFNSIPTFRPIKIPGYKEPMTAIPFGAHFGAYYASSSKRFKWTNDKYGFHGYPSDDWWWYEVAFDLFVPFPDVVPENTHGIVRGLKLDSVIWMLDSGGLPGQPDGIQDVEFGIALPLVWDMGKDLKLNDHLWGFFGRSELIVEPFLRYAIDAQNFDTKDGRWKDQDEIFGGVAIVYAF